MSSADSSYLQVLSAKLVARKNCIESGNSAWIDRHTKAIHKLLDWLAPNANFVFHEADGDNNAITLSGEWHKMDSNGYWSGWHDFDMRIRAGFVYHDVELNGPTLDEDDCDYLIEVLMDRLEEPVGREI